MPRTVTQKKLKVSKVMEAALWESANKLRGAVEPAEYKHVEPEYCYSATRKEIEQKGYSLVPSKYIEFRNRDEQIDFDAKMKELQTDLRDLLQQEEESTKELKDLFEKLGYSL